MKKKNDNINELKNKNNNSGSSKVNEKKAKIKKNIGVVNNKLIEATTINIEDTIGMENYTTETIKIEKNKKDHIDNTNVIFKELSINNNHKNKKELWTIITIASCVLLAVILLITFLFVK